MPTGRSVLCTMALLATGTAVHADPPDDLFELEMEELLQLRIPLTGTRLQRNASHSVSPLAIYTRAEIDASGAFTLGEFLQTLPSNGSVLNNNGSSGTAHGSASVNLRNLGENRTLVLLNGRRLANGTATRGFRDFVDLNTVPLALIQRIEVLGAGASAVYGADAIAGVVNLISRGDFNGSRLHVDGGQSGHGDGQQHRIDWLGGRQESQWSVWGGASWQRSRPILVEQREFSAEPLGALVTTTPQGRYRVPGFGQLTLRDGASGDSLADFRPFNLQQDSHNPFTGTYLRYPSEQQALFGEGHLQAGTVRWFGEALWLRRESEQNFSAASTGVTGAAGFTMPADHPFNPFGIDLGGSDFSASRSLQPLGRRINQQRVDTQRLVLGAQGRWWRDWQWELTASGARNRGQFLAFNQLNRDHLALAIGPTAACAAVSGCVPVPLFGADGRFTADMLDWLRVNGHDRNDVEQLSLQANTHGELLTLPAGPLQLAAGLEYRRETASDRPDPVISGVAQYIDGAPTSGQVRDGTDGAYRAAEAFIELDAPLWQGRNGAVLQANAAARYSHYDSFGGATTGRLGIWFAPNAQWTFRATAAQAFRAPSILELFEGGRITNLPGIDPCVGGPALPGCVGVPASYQQSGSQVTSLVSGNPDLKPETARQFNLGARWQWAETWSLSAEAYRIQIEQLLLSFSSQQILDDCAFAGRRCGLIRRNPTSGSIVLLSVQRDNAGQRQVDGLDLELNGAWGAWSLRAQSSYLHRFEERSDSGNEANIEQLAGRQLLRASHPRWRSLLALDWQHRDWQASWRWRYLHSMREASDTPAIGAVNYHDLQLARQFGSLRGHIGIANLFDQDPPLSQVNANINFDIATYDPRGRFVYAGLDWRW